MTRRFVTVLSLLLVTSAAAAQLRPAAQAAAAGPLPTADEIVARHVAAIGGGERLAGVRTLVVRGRHAEGDFVIPDAAYAKMRPYFKLVGDPDKPSTDFAEGYDGSAWEFYGDPGIVLRTVGAAAAASRHGTSIDGPLASYRAQGSTVTVEGIEPILGRDAYRLRVRMRDGFEEEEFIDAKSWLLVAARKAAPVHAFGAAVRSLTLFGDYRPVEGVLFAHSVKEVETGTGKVLNAWTTTSIAVNRVLKPNVFSPPSFVHSPLQSMLEQLFAERADTAAVLWTYHDFRRAHPAVNTDEGIQAIGYQMLNMGDRASAIALLGTNAAEHPRSSGAAFALGRAYQTAGDAARARAPLRRALALDPKHRRAAAALAELGQGK